MIGSRLPLAGVRNAVEIPAIRIKIAITTKVEG
jgi:hypothetical protein